MTLHPLTFHGVHWCRFLSYIVKTCCNSQCTELLFSQVFPPRPLTSCSCVKLCCSDVHLELLWTAILGYKPLFPGVSVCLFLGSFSYLAEIFFLVISLRKKNPLRLTFWIHKCPQISWVCPYIWQSLWLDFQIKTCFLLHLQALFYPAELTSYCVSDSFLWGPSVFSLSWSFLGFIFDPGYCENASCVFRYGSLYHSRCFQLQALELPTHSCLRDKEIY